MFAKVYSQIFASSIAENYTTRHVFMDMLVLADSEGVVDMTMSAISRTTNVPIEIVEAAIKELSEPDTASRSPLEDGRRIALVDSHRDWGWRIINYDHYRSLRDEEARRSYNRNYMRDYREKTKPVKDVKKRKKSSTPVDSGKALSTHAEGEGEADVKPLSGFKGVEIPESLNTPEFMAMWKEWIAHRKEKGKPLTERSARMQLTQCDESGLAKSLVGIRNSIANNYQGLIMPKDWEMKKEHQQAQKTTQAMSKIRLV